MLNDIKKTSKHSVVYAIGNIATKIIGLILIPIYTDADYLSHADYGALSVLEATSQLLIGLLSMAMGVSLSRWYWEKGNIQKQKSIFFTTVMFLILCIIPIVAFLSLSSDYFSKLLFTTYDYSYLLRLTVFVSAFQIINNQVLTLAKLKSRSMMYSLMQIVKLLVTLGLILWGILVKGRGLNAIWEANLAGEIFVLILLLPFTSKNIQIRFHLKVLKEMLTYGMPLMLASVSGVLLSTADRYMLSSMSSLENTGVYSLGFRIANTLKVVVSMSLLNALTPIRYKKIGMPGNQRFYSKVATYSSWIFVMALLALSLFSLEILKVFTGSKLYWEANGVVPIISFALFFGLLKDNVNFGLVIKKKTKIMGILIFLTSMLNIGLNLFLIPFFDIYGAACATLFSQFFFFLGVTVAAQKVYAIPYEWKKIATMIVLATVIVIAGLAVSNIEVVARLIVKFFLFISFPFVLLFLGFYDKVEVENIKKIASNWSNPRKIKENIKRFID